MDYILLVKLNYIYIEFSALRPFKRIRYNKYSIPKFNDSIA